MQPKKVWIPATMAMMLAIPAAGAFAEIPSSVENQKETQEWEKHHKGHQGHGHHHKYHHGKHFGPHKEAYYLLLAEKHTPGAVEQWKAAFTERKNLMKEFKALGLKEKMKQGEISKEQLMERHKEWKEKAKSAREERQAIREEFTAAIESNDSKQIAAVMPKLLEQIQKENQHMKSKLEDLKSLAEQSKNKGK